MAGAPRIYAQMATMLGKYSQFATAGEKAAVRQSLSLKRTSK
jgi:myo-inositol-1(or 4)-monophosphatase